MSRALSVYLDLIRFLAAMVVFVSHASFDVFSGQWLQPANLYGDEAVIVFFVLSGFVIAFVSDQREVTLKDYAIARAARIYSVCLPAVLLIALFDAVGVRLDPSTYRADWHDDMILKGLISLLFLNEVWFNATQLYSNSPYWSLSFEVWFYLVFGAAFYLRGWTRLFAVALLALIAGPKIAALFPVWLLGAAAYKVAKRTDNPGPAMWVVFLGSTFVTLGFVYLSEELRFAEEALTGRLDFGRSSTFIEAFALGLLVAFNFAAFSKLPESSLRWLVSAGPTIRALASCSFTLYVFHLPLLHFYGAVFSKGEPVPRNLLISTLTLLTVMLLARITEHKKNELASAIKTGLRYASSNSHKV